MNCAVTAAAQSMAMLTAVRCDGEAFIPFDWRAETHPITVTKYNSHPVLDPASAPPLRRVASDPTSQRSSGGPQADRPVAAGSAAATAITRIAVALTYRDFRVLWIGAFTSSNG